MKTKKLLSVILWVLAAVAIILSPIFGVINNKAYGEAVAEYDAALARYEIAHKAYLEDKDTYQNEDRRALQQPDEENIVYIDIRGYGLITVRLFPEVAPITVNNFKKLASEGFYDHLTFHRIIKGFMIQGGDPDGDGTGGSGKNIKGEFSANGVDNKLSHSAGVISMARSEAYNSASSQFFIVHESSPHLDGKYAAFGKVTIGMDIVNAIASVETNSSDRPLTPVYIRTVTMDRENVETLKEPIAPEALRPLRYFVPTLIVAPAAVLAAAAATVLTILFVREDKAIKAARLAEIEENRRAALEAARSRRKGKKK